MAEARGRRRWTVEQKRRIVEETLTPGASVSVVARRYDINANLLFKWKREAEAGQLGGAAWRPPAVADLVPIGVVGRRSTTARRRCSPACPSDGERAASRVKPCRSAELAAAAAQTGGVIEIDLPCGTRVRVDAAVDATGAGSGARRAEAVRMIQVAPGTKVYLACRPVSMRYGFDGLSAKVASVLARDPFSGHLFLLSQQAR